MINRVLGVEELTAFCNAGEKDVMRSGEELLSFDRNSFTSMWFPAKVGSGPGGDEEDGESDGETAIG